MTARFTFHRSFDTLAHEMASAFGHSAAALGLSIWNRRLARLPRFWFWMVASSILPDIDSIGYKLGVHYDTVFGHRGFTHSILFAALWSGLVAICVFRAHLKSAWIFLFAATLSHGLIDALTNGGLGVGFFIPFNDTRYFFPVHPIQVSPISVTRFFSPQGIRILYSEALWIGIPVLASLVLGYL